MGKMSRNKGKVGEREVAALLREHGFEGRRGVQYQGGPDSADVVGLPGWHVEVKRTETLSAYAALNQALEDCGDNFPVVLHRRNNEPWIAIFEAEVFLRLIKAASNGG